tara:strand:- start:99 stop:392 length:294 start_codon:yes stop_codon:yes gene_type:complete
MDKAQFKRIKNKILKKFPNATTRVDSSGKFFVSDGEGNTLTTEYMIPPQLSVSMAWFWFAETIRINQNIERTNPKRMDAMDFEKKFNRVSNRNKRKK